MAKVFALDLGTTKFCLAELNLRSKNKDELVKMVMVDALGMRRGMLADFDQAKMALMRLIEIAESEFHSDIDKVIVSISGSHLYSEVLNEEVAINKKPINQQILNKLQTLASQNHSKYKAAPLECIPTNYALDKRGYLDNPIGFTGDNLMGQFLYVHADQNYLKDVIRLCNQSGLRVERLFAEPIVSANAIIDPMSLPHGFVVADIGGGTTDATIFINHKPSKIFTIDIGGKMFTNDLSLGLSIDLPSAERIKLEVGMIPRNDLTEKERQAQFILKARAQELASLLDMEIKPIKGLLKSGILLTGGGACLRGIGEVVSEILKLPVEIKQAKINAKIAPSLDMDLYFASKYATVIGLLVGYANLQKIMREPSKFSFFEKYFSGFSNWLSEMS